MSRTVLIAPLEVRSYFPEKQKNQTTTFMHCFPSPLPEAPSRCENYIKHYL